MLSKLQTYCYLYPHPVCHISFNAQNLHTSGSNFCKGADVSWLSEMEANGYKFYNDDGIEQDCLQILKTMDRLNQTQGMGQSSKRLLQQRRDN